MRKKKGNIVVNNYLLRELCKVFKLSHILLDTTCLIDSLRHPQEMKPVFEELIGNGCIFITIDSVAIEFYKGSASLESFDLKKEVINKLQIAVIPTDKTVNEYAAEMALVYGIRSKDVSSTDYFLGGVLAKYKRSDTFLMTRDHGDFPATIFDRVVVLPIEYEYEVHTYGFYKFNQNKYDGRLKKFMRSSKAR